MNRAPGADDSHLRRRLLIVASLFTVAFAVFGIADRRVPREHETATYYAMQFFFLSAASQDGQIPLWVPFAAHGTVSGPMLAAQSGLLQPVLLLLAPALEGRGFAPVFHLGVLAEEIVLLLGSWMLATRYYRSARTVFFVSIAAAGSTLWMDSIWLDFHMVFAFPLVAALLHEHAETGVRSRLLLAGLWTALATSGLPPALTPVPLLMGVLYSVALRFPFRPLAAAAFIVALLPLAMAALPGAGALVPDGPPPAASRINPLGLLDLAIGIAPDLDASLYCGFFTLVLAVLGLVWTPSPLRRRLIVTCLGSLLVLGLLLMVFIPNRSLPVCAPVLRLMLVFLSGLGFEKLLERDPACLPSLRWGAGGLLALSVVLAALSAAAVLDEEFVEYLVNAVSGHARSPLVSDSAVLSELLGISSFTAGLGGASLLIRASGPRWAAAALFLILLLHSLDLMGWKFRMGWLKTLSAAPDSALHHALGPLPYRPRRVPLKVLLRDKGDRMLEIPRPRLVPRLPGAVTFLDEPLDVPPPLGLRMPGSRDSDVDKIKFSAALAHQVVGFGADRLELRVEVPPGGARMVYADSWAAGWVAEVNGAAVPIEHADPSYKALRLEPGPSIVRLHYHSPGRAWAYRLAAIPALLGLLSIPFLAAGAWRNAA